MAVPCVLAAGRSSLNCSTLRCLPLSRSYVTRRTEGLWGGPVCPLFSLKRHGVTEGATNKGTAALPVEIVGDGNKGFL